MSPSFTIIGNYLISCVSIFGLCLGYFFPEDKGILSPHLKHNHTFISSYPLYHLIVCYFSHTRYLKKAHFLRLIFSPGFHNSRYSAFTEICSHKGHFTGLVLHLPGSSAESLQAWLLELDPPNSHPHYAIH
jgi:hypothetical protein